MIAIITLVMSTAVPALQRITNQRINATTRTFMGLVRSLRSDSILLNSTHRLVLDLDEKTYWVEQQKAFQLLSETPEELPPKKGVKQEPPPSNFSLVSKYSSGPKRMPDGVQFLGVLKEQEGLRKEGVVYIHFFPNGFVEQSVLYLAKSGTEEVSYSVVIRPTSGKVEIERSHVKSFD